MTVFSYIKQPSHKAQPLGKKNNECRIPVRWAGLGKAEKKAVGKSEISGGESGWPIRNLETSEQP